MVHRSLFTEHVPLCADSLTCTRDCPLIVSPTSLIFLGRALLWFSLYFPAPSIAEEILDKPPLTLGVTCRNPVAVIAH